MKRKRYKIKKKALGFMAISLLLVAISLFKTFSFAYPNNEEKTKKVSVSDINDYENMQDNLVSRIDFDDKITNIVSIVDDRYISKLFNFKTGEEVSIESILKNDMVDAFFKKVKELLYLKYPKFIASKLELLNKTNSYYLKENELIMYFYDYEIEPMVSEELSLHINYNEIKEYLDITVKKVYNNGMEIGYHSYAHKNFKRQKLQEIKEEFNKSNSILKSITGSTFKLIRPPYGEINEKIKNSLDASFILWNIDTLDWKNKDSDYLTDYVLKEVNDGNIILFHDIHKTSIDAIN